MGPYLTIQALEPEFAGESVSYLVDGVSKEERTREGLPYLDLNQIEQRWDSLTNFFHQRGVKAVIISTSDGVVQQNVEELSSLAAAEAGVPVFVVEDFPGNYWPKRLAPLNGLFVEDDSVVDLHLSRGVCPGLVHGTGNPRYAQLTKHNTAEQRTNSRKALGLNGERVVLWAGQPNDDDSYRALARLIEHFPKQQFTLLFRAHPRDEAYSAGKYTELLATAPNVVLDVSANPDALGLYCASDLVITQFSSAAVEACYMGIPALFVLFDDLGKRYLKTNKGYDSLPWCNEGCAFLIEKEDEIALMLESAIFDEPSRLKVSSNFQRRFVAKTDSARTIAGVIRAAADLD